MDFAYNSKTNKIIFIIKYTQIIGKSFIIRSLFKKFHLCFPIKFKKGYYSPLLVLQNRYKAGLGFKVDQN